MTPEEQIALVKEEISYNEYHNYNSSDILDHFDTHKQYREAREIYWDNMIRYNLSPYGKEIPPVRTADEWTLWFAFNELMKRKFYLNK